MDAWVALLRGVNVGGNNKLPMKELVKLFEAAGCDRVQSYIQSGNVVFGAAPKLAAAIPARIAAGIERRFAFRSPVVVRSASALAALVEKNPFAAEAAADPARVHAVFLADRPSAARAAALDPQRSPPDRFAVSGSDVYLHLPNGAAKTRLTNAWFDAQLQTVSTARNWRTVLTLLELASR